jgi:hypothetical protein
VQAGEGHARGRRERVLLGISSASGARPTGASIAAVTPTTSSRSRAIDTISSAKTAVYPNREGETGSPVSGWIFPTAWKWSAMSSSAGW